MNYTIRKSDRTGDQYYEIHHPSGLTVLVYPKEGFTSTYALFAANFGSICNRFVRDGREITVPDGTAHYLEHKLFESEDGDAFSKYAKTGASANAFTSFDMTGYLFQCSDKFAESLEILIDLIQSPYFTPETVAKEQGIIGQEIKMYQDNPDWCALMNLLGGLSHNHPIHTDIAGDIQSIAQITPEILYECYNSYYNLHNMLLCVAGKADPDEVLSILDEKLKPAEPFTTETIFPEEPYEVVKHYVEQKMPVAVPSFHLGFKLTKSTTELPDPKEVSTISIILDAFAGSGSKLYRELTDKGLVNASFSYDMSEGVGYGVIVFSGETHKPDEAAGYILQAVRELCREGVPADLFEEAKRSVYGQAVSVSDHPSSIASALANCFFTGREMFDSMDVTASLTLEEANEVIRHILDPDNYCLSVIRPLET